MAALPWRHPYFSVCGQRQNQPSPYVLRVVTHRCNSSCSEFYVKKSIVGLQVEAHTHNCIGQRLQKIGKNFNSLRHFMSMEHENILYTRNMTVFSAVSKYTVCRNIDRKQNKKPDIYMKLCMCEITCNMYRNRQSIKEWSQICSVLAAYVICGAVV